MNRSAIKTIVVKLHPDNICEFDIDVDIFDDPFLEAATRSIEKTRKEKYGIVRAIIECWDKKLPDKSYAYNSYWLLVNASCFFKAEQLRDKFKMQTGYDLSLEPVSREGNRNSKNSK